MSRGFNADCSSWFDIPKVTAEEKARYVNLAVEAECRLEIFRAAMQTLGIGNAGRNPVCGRDCIVDGPHSHSGPF